MKKNHLYIIGGIIAILIIIGIFSPDAEKAAFNNTAKDVQIITNTDSVLLAPDITETSITPSKFYSVVSVVDGDTIKLNMDGKTETFRLIGIDTPETVDPRKDVQCFGIEASNKAKELLGGKLVSLESDETQGDRDKYKRLLRYVFLPDGTNFNLYMISEGYAFEYTYANPYKYQFDFRQAQKLAMENEKGLWSPSTCSGNK